MLVFSMEPLTPLQKNTAQAIVNIFETGRPFGDYTRVTVRSGDAGHLSYGRSQVSLSSGMLGEMLADYVGAPAGAYRAPLERYLPRARSRDLTLDNDLNFRSLLHLAGSDLAMRRVQDSFFDHLYWDPAESAAARLGIATALGRTVIYDSFIQGGFWRTASAVPRAAEQKWIADYIEARRRALLSGRPPLPSSAYRTVTFAQLIQLSNWNLTLPLTVHGVHLTSAMLLPPQALAA
jgi:chitosanase